MKQHNMQRRPHPSASISSPHFSEAIIRKDIGVAASHPDFVPHSPYAVGPFEKEVHRALLGLHFSHRESLLSSAGPSSSPSSHRSLSHSFRRPFSKLELYYIKICCACLGLELSQNERELVAVCAPEKRAADYIVYNAGYIALKGRFIQESAKKCLESPLGKQLVTPRHVSNRTSRDKGDWNHVTILSREEVPKACAELGFLAASSGNSDKAMEMLMEFLAKNLKIDWKLEGLGKVSKDGNTAFFAVLNWESTEVFVKQHFPFLAKRDYHVALGFVEKDIHDMPKNRSTLIWTHVCREPQVLQLVDENKSQNSDSVEA